MKVTVIIPIYNAEKYLRECIDSVWKQTFKNYELILVDDGSTDFSGQICDEYAKDGKVKVIHKKNEGLIRARMDGLKAAEGEYIAFVDADDWIEEDFLAVLVKEMSENHADIVMMGCVKEKGYEAQILMNNIPSGIYGKDRLAEDIIPKMLHYRGFYEFGILPYMWNKLYKKEMIQNCYENINTNIYDGEDVAVVYPYLLKAKKAVILSMAKYHYRIHEQAMTAVKKKDYYENCSYLYLYLAMKFKKSKYGEIMMPQLDQYMRMMIWQGGRKNFIEAEKYIFPFGKVPKDATVILYGAGIVGRTYYNQIEKTKYCKVAAWVDKNYKKDDLRRLGVTGMADIEHKKYQFIVIAIENSAIVKEIIMDIQNKGIDKNKIIY